MSGWLRMLGLFLREVNSVVELFVNFLFSPPTYSTVLAVTTAVRRPHYETYIHSTGLVIAVSLAITLDNNPLITITLYEVDKLADQFAS